MMSSLILEKDGGGSPILSVDEYVRMGRDE
jgi:hypothetical protein